MNTFLWVIVPYLCLATFAVGHVWRYRYDKFGWTTRSSQLYEDRLLRLGSPLFHFGMLGVVGGHIIGLLVPRSWTETVGVDDHLYHLVAVIGGLIAGLMALAGMAFGWWGLETVSGRRHFDEMAGMIPFFVGVGSLILLLLAAILYYFAGRQA